MPFRYLADMYLRLPAVALAAVGILAGISLGSLSSVLWINLFVVVLCFLDIALAPSPSSIAVSREADSATRVGQPIVQTLTLTNSSRRRVAGQIRDAWPPSAGVEPSRHSFAIPAGERRRVQASLAPSRRGTRYSEAVTVRTTGPLRLAGRQRSFESPWQLRVLPPFNSRRHVPSRVQRLRELEGRALLLVRGQGTEFDSLREYVAGDDVRAIDWRSTARLGDTVVRTWRPERDRQVVILLDAGRSGALRMGDGTAFDSFIESTLLLATLAIRAGDRVSVVALDDEVKTRLSGTQTTMMNKIAEGLADVHPSLAATDWTSAITTIKKLTRRPAFVVLLTHLGGGSVQSGLFEAISTLRRTHTVLVASTHTARDGVGSLDHTLEQVYESAAFSRGDVEKDAVAREIERAGAFVVRSDAEGLPPKVTDTYLELKARGKL